LIRTSPEWWLKKDIPSAQLTIVFIARVIKKTHGFFMARHSNVCKPAQVGIAGRQFRIKS